MRYFFVGMTDTTDEDFTELSLIRQDGEAYYRLATEDAYGKRWSRQQRRTRLGKNSRTAKATRIGRFRDPRFFDWIGREITEGEAAMILFEIREDDE